MAIALVHLVWAPLGIEPTLRFLESYRRHSAGAEHELVLLLNGAGEGGPVTGEAAESLVSELSRESARIIRLRRPLLDLAAYREGAAQLPHERLCFVNSHARIEAEDWLGKLDAALSGPLAGLAGATGSWASSRSQALYARGLPSAYRGVFGGRAEMRRGFEELQSEREGERDPGLPARLRGALNTWRATFEAARLFPPFPAPHLRTNTIMVSAELFAALEFRELRRKLHAYELESGRASLTRQVLDRGRRVLVVDAEGEPYEHPDWPRSRTFWQGEQEGLMVSDNQTEAYRSASWERRVLLSRYAWGAEADPATPPSRTNTAV